jgi:hypothetical protein
MKTAQQHWGGLSQTWKWLTSVSTGAAAIVAAYFAMAGMWNAVDEWVVTEAEAAETQEAQLEILKEYGEDLANERRQREINDTVLELQRIDFQVQYLINLSARNPDQQLQLDTIREMQTILRKRIRYLRCLDDGRPPDECSV